MQIFQNTWFVGISTGIISGILVFFLTKWMMDKKGKTEYYKQVKNANHTVINSLKPYIADQGLPTIDIFEALISSLAREFGVDEKDMYSVGSYCEELIREIISDVYVSNEKKNEYMTSLAQYKKNVIQNKDIQNKDVVFDALVTYRTEMQDQMSTFVSMLAAGMTVLVGALCSTIVPLVFRNEKNEISRSFWFPFDKNPILWVPIVLLVIVFVMIMTTRMIDIFIKSRKKNDDNSKKSKREENNNG